MTTVDLTTAELEHLVLARGTSPDLEWVEVDGECIVWCSRDEKLHRLNPTATVLFRLSDGQITVGKCIDDLAALYEADHEVLRADVIQCVTHLLAAGLLRTGT